MISLIVAATDNNVIGKNNALPWRLPADLSYFKQTTMGHPVIMGRKTYESIGHVLSERTNVVITRQKHYQANGCIVVGSLEQAIEVARKSDGADEIFIIGGAEIYDQTIDLADRIYLTRIHVKLEGDTFFKFEQSKWREVSREKHKANAQNKYAYDFMVLERKIIATYPSKVG